MAHTTDEQLLAAKRNTSRFFVENRQIACVILIGTVIWGIWGYLKMPQGRDPIIPVREALVVVPWPGASSKRVEQLVTRQVEKTVAQNAQVTRIESVSRSGLSLVYVSLNEYANLNVSSEFDDVAQKLSNLHTLPQGAGPIRFLKDFGDTTTLMLTVASPQVSRQEVMIRAHVMQNAIIQARRNRGYSRSGMQFSILYCYPLSISPAVIESPFRLLIQHFQDRYIASSLKLIERPGCIAMDGLSAESDHTLLSRARHYLQDTLQLSSLNPDAWDPVVVRDPETIAEKLSEAAGPEYNYSQMDEYTNEIEKTVHRLSSVSIVSRTGNLPEAVYLLYSQEELAAYGLQPALLKKVLAQRNIILPGGQIDVQGRTVDVSPSGAFKDANQLSNVAVAVSQEGAPVYLRDLAEVVTGYQDPPQLLNDYYVRNPDTGDWQRLRAVTISIEMRPGYKIGAFGDEVNRALMGVRKRLPSDLIIARTSDQPKQVREYVHLFMKSLFEATVLVVIVVGIGFWEWRSALLIALCIPLTLCMTFGFMTLLGVDIQQVSIASLIIALGLLVDDPVVAGDAIKRELAAGKKREIAAWLGPTKLATAILFATITNIAAYLPFLLLNGDVGRFIYSLPIVMACSLVASRIVSMTFLPLLSFYLLGEVPNHVEARTSGVFRVYRNLINWCITNRHKAFLLAALFPLIGFLAFLQIQQAFFPHDLQSLSTVDIWLPDDASITATARIERQAERIVQQTAHEYSLKHHEHQALLSVTGFVGGGGPRFWFALTPEQQQPNYAQLVLETRNKQDTSPLAEIIQRNLSEKIAGAVVDVRQLETGSPVGIPVAERISGSKIDELEKIASRVKAIYRDIPFAQRVRDDWGKQGFRIKVQIKNDRANLSSITNEDVALASQAALSGQQVGNLDIGDKQIPIIARLRPEERAQLQDLGSLYVFSSQGSEHVPISQVAAFTPELQWMKIRRRNQFRTITVSCFPADGFLASQVVHATRKRIEALQRSLPAGYRMEAGGEAEAQAKGFHQLAFVLLVSVLFTYTALAIQFMSAIKPLIVFAAVPFGMIGSILALMITGQPFGFMAFLGIISLVGVIVSHIIVLFDFIEEKRMQGEPLEEALLQAGIFRLRPILITVGATVLALIPLAVHGGPFWQPLCYAQIGGLAAATAITLLLVPILYSIFVKDLHWIKWETSSDNDLD